MKQRGMKSIYCPNYFIIVVLVFINFYNLVPLFNEGKYFISC